MKTIRLVIAFLTLNFLALFLGGLFTGAGVSSDWYQSLNQAPWTPPGWVFGVAWTTIMICFSIYMTKLVQSSRNLRRVLIIFAIQWVLNVIWNPLFFYYRETTFGFVVISILTFLIAYILVANIQKVKKWSMLLLPYFIWLCIATSLNFYIIFYN